MGSNKYDNTGSFIPLAYMGYRHHLEEGNFPHPRCPRCDILVPWSALNRRHLATAQCAKGADRKLRRLEEEALQESSERAFQAYR